MRTFAARCCGALKCIRMIAAIYVSSAIYFQFTTLRISHGYWLHGGLQKPQNCQNWGIAGFHTDEGGGALGFPHKFENHDVIITSTATIRSTTKYSIIIAEPDNSCP